MAMRFRLRKAMKAAAGKRRKAMKADLARLFSQTSLTDEQAFDAADKLGVVTVNNLQSLTLADLDEVALSVVQKVALKSLLSKSFKKGKLGKESSKAEESSRAATGEPFNAAVLDRVASKFEKWHSVNHPTTGKQLSMRKAQFRNVFKQKTRGKPLELKKHFVKRAHLPLGKAVDPVLFKNYKSSRRFKKYKLFLAETKLGDIQTNGELKAALQKLKY
jgi:hypothetical protein